MISGVAVFGLMTIGAIGATVSGDYASTTDAVIGNVLFDLPFVILTVLLIRHVRRSRKRRPQASGAPKDSPRLPAREG